VTCNAIGICPLLPCFTRRTRSYRWHVVCSCIYTHMECLPSYTSKSGESRDAQSLGVCGNSFHHVLSMFLSALGLPRREPRLDALSRRRPRTLLILDTKVTRENVTRSFFPSSFKAQSPGVLGESLRRHQEAPQFHNRQLAGHRRMNPISQIIDLNCADKIVQRLSRYRILEHWIVYKPSLVVPGQCRSLCSSLPSCAISQDDSMMDCADDHREYRVICFFVLS